MNFARNPEERGFQNRNHALGAGGLQALLPRSQPKQDLIKVQPQLWGFHADATPPISLLDAGAKTNVRICIHVWRPKERHRNIPNQQGTIPLCPTPNHSLHMKLLW